MLELMARLDAGSLSRLCRTSKGFYVYGMHEDTWRALTLTELEGRFTFHGTWRATYLASHPTWQAQLRGGSDAAFAAGEPICAHSGMQNVECRMENVDGW